MTVTNSNGRVDRVIREYNPTIPPAGAILIRDCSGTMAWLRKPAGGWPKGTSPLAQFRYFATSREAMQLSREMRQRAAADPGLEWDAATSSYRRVGKAGRGAAAGSPESSGAASSSTEGRSRDDSAPAPAAGDPCRWFDRAATETSAPPAPHRKFSPLCDLDRRGPAT